MEDIQQKVLLKVSAQIKSERFKEALKFLGSYKNIFTGKNRERYIFLRGYLNLKAGFPDKAKTIFEKLSKSRPRKSIYHYFLGVSNLELANYKESINNFKEALLISPNSKQYLKNYGWAHVLVGKKKGLNALNRLFKEELEDKDLFLKYIFALVKFNKIPMAKWLAELGQRKFEDEEFKELLEALKDPRNYQNITLSEAEEKVLALIRLRSQFDTDEMEEMLWLFMKMRGKIYKRIGKVELWAAAFEIATRIFMGEEVVDERKICKKYNVDEKKVRRILWKIFKGGML